MQKTLTAKLKSAHAERPFTPFIYQRIILILTSMLHVNVEAAYHTNFIQFFLLFFFFQMIVTVISIDGTL